MIAVAENLLKVISSQEAEIHKLREHTVKLFAENQRVVEKITALEEKINDCAFPEPNLAISEKEIDRLFKEMASQFQACNDYNTDWCDTEERDKNLNGSGSTTLPFIKESLVFFYDGFKISGRFREFPCGDPKEWRVCLCVQLRGKIVDSPLNAKLDDIRLYEAAKLIHAAAAMQ